MNRTIIAWMHTFVLAIAASQGCNWEAGRGGSAGQGGGTAGSGGGAGTGGCPSATWFADEDHDGFGNPAKAVDACDAPPGYVGNGDDCDDMDALLYPGSASAPPFVLDRCGQGL